MQKGFPRFPGQRTGVMAAACAVQREMDERDSAPPSVRPIEEILLTYDLSHIRLPMAELELLWRFVMAAGAISNGYVEELPRVLDGTLDRSSASQLFCKLWGLASLHEDYNKKHWTLLRQQLFLYGVML